MSPARSARHLLRNGLDYIELGAYQRALELLHEAQSRQFELNDAERNDLQAAIQRARQSMRESGLGVTDTEALVRRPSATRPGAIAVSAPAPETLALPDEPLQLADASEDAPRDPEVAVTQATTGPALHPVESFPAAPLNLPALPARPTTMGPTEQPEPAVPTGTQTTTVEAPGSLPMTISDLPTPRDDLPGRPAPPPLSAVEPTAAPDDLETAPMPWRRRRSPTCPNRRPRRSPNH